MSGQIRRAVSLFEGYISVSEKRNDKTNTAIGLGNVATQQLILGSLNLAERNLRRKIKLCRKKVVDDELFQEAVGHQALGRVLSYRGAWHEAEQELLKSQKIFDGMGTVETNLGSGNWAYRSLHRLVIW
ncbi:MAG: hypothetical protein IPL71_11580 [Anaerolineales bacterium]|uniref:hypothetical protein n=1 Tax=Candidatus Villigracilis proximus TaxID=3140683 RepID=UPI003134BC80|nr:hypothetical protein [Anaerolineales bacterium]